MAKGHRAGVDHDRLRRLWPLAALAAVCAASAVAILFAERGLTFFYDEWDWVLGRRPWTLAAFLKPHNEHLMVFPVAVYKALFATAGITHYWPYALPALAAHLVCLVLVFALVRRRLGSAVALLALLPVALLGAGSDDLLWGINLGFDTSLGAALAIMVVLERLPRRRADPAACLLLVLSLASSSLGIAVAAGVLADVLWRADRLRRLWVALVPIALYGFWYVGYGVGGVHGSNVPKVPRYAFDAAASAVGGYTGVGLDRGRLLLALGVVVAVAGALVARRIESRTPLILAIPIAFWVLTALGRAQLQEPTASRYVYPGAVLSVVAAAQLARRRQIPRLLIALLAVSAVAAALTNYGDLRSAARSRRQQDGVVTAELGALQLAAHYVSPAFRPDPTVAPQISAGPYLAAVRALGSPGDTPAKLAAGSPRERAAADRVLIAALGPALIAAPSPSGGAPPKPDAQAAGTSRETASACLRPAASSSPPLQATIPPTGLVIRARRAPVAVRVRRFSSAYPPVALVVVRPGASITLAPPPDQAQRHAWHVALSGGPVSACRRAPAG